MVRKQRAEEIIDSLGWSRHNSQVDLQRFLAMFLRRPQVTPEEKEEAKALHEKRVEEEAAGLSEEVERPSGHPITASIRLQESTNLRQKDSGKKRRRGP